MSKKILIFFFVSVFMSGAVAAQDARVVLQQASTAMGTAKSEIRSVFWHRVECRDRPELQHGRRLAAVRRD